MERTLLECQDTRVTVTALGLIQGGGGGVFLPKLQALLQAVAHGDSGAWAPLSDVSETLC